MGKRSANHVGLARILTMIEHMKKHHSTVDELAIRYNASKRSIYRYLILMGDAGLLVEKDFDGKYFICD